MTELWRSVVGFALYEVSSEGTIRSLENKQTYWRMGQLVERVRKGTVLTPGETAKAPFYKRVTLVKDGKNYYRSVHRLVCEAFKGPAPKGYECCHLNDIAHDNRADNLVWGTPRENYEMGIANGKQPKNKLTKEAVEQIRADRKAGVSALEIASKYSISKYHVWHIASHKAWAWVD